LSVSESVTEHPPSLISFDDRWSFLQTVRIIICIQHPASSYWIRCIVHIQICKTRVHRG
jgi:hypothetical protein